MKTEFSRPSSRRATLLLTLLSALNGQLSTVHAATRTWDGDGANKNWTTATNWVGDIAPVPGDDLVFPPGAAQLFNNNNYPAGTMFNTVTFSGDGYICEGSNVVLTAGLRAGHSSGVIQVWFPIQLSASQTFTNSSGGELYFVFQSIDLNGHDLTFGVGVSGVQTDCIIGTGAVIKTGAGSLILSGTSTYTGATEVRQGTVLVTSGGSLGATNGSTTVFAGATLNPGSTFTSPEALVLFGTLRIGGFSFGTNTWLGPILLMATNVCVSASGLARANLDGPISGTGGLTQNGPGTLALNGINTYTGATTNSAGLLIVNGYQPQSPIALTGGTLAGAGVVGAIAASGDEAKTLAPGDSPGILTCSNVALSASTTFWVELNGPIPGSGHDQLNVKGSVNLNNCTLSSSLGYAPALGDSFTIINNDGDDAVKGTFNGLPEGATFAVGTDLFQISYAGGDGNDVVLTRLAAPGAGPRLAIQLLSLSAVRLLWPTNPPGFDLEFNTNVVGTNWLGASPPPTVAGTNYMVTNATIEAQRFYRLKRN
jgi:autotransporter-associated beta strand protein